VIRRVIETVGITYCAAPNASCGCEDVAAIPVPGEKSNQQIDADAPIAAHDLPVDHGQMERVVQRSLQALVRVGDGGIERGRRWRRRLLWRC
jgi:hypothetical protein